MKKKWRPNITVILFCLLIYGCTAAAIAAPDREFSETENRVLADMPKISADTILSGDFEADYEEYLTDQFVWRDQWISLKTSVERMLLKRESKDIYFAEDGYLIEKHTGIYTTQTAERNISALVSFVEQYEEQFGPGHLSVMIVPNAVDILQDKLPPLAGSGGGKDYLERMEKSLPEEVWFDCMPILQEHSSEEIYYHTDHHWKTLAAFYVYQAWAEKQGYEIPDTADYEIRTVTDCFEGTVQSKLGIGTAGDTIELFLSSEEPAYTVYHGFVEEKRSVEGEHTVYDPAALDTKDKYAVFLGGNEPFLRIVTEASGERRILVVKDSFANCFVPFMVGEFQEIDVLDLRYTSRKMDEIIAQGEYTDILILYNVSGFAEDINIAKLANTAADG